MKKLFLITVLLIFCNFGFAGNSNAIAYEGGKLLGNLVLIGIVVLIIWLIFRKRRN